MKRFLLACASISLLAGTSCGSDATVKPGGSGGQTGSGGASSGSGGAATGGETSSGGTVGSGGTSAGSGGTTTTGSGGKATSSGGVEGSTGGVMGSGGVTPGTGGTAPGTGGGSQGGAVGTGGTGAGTGGMQAGGHPGTGGTSPGTGGGAGGATDLMSVVAAWDGQLVQFPCGTSGSGYDCANVGCVNNMATKTTMWTMAGTASTVYSVTFNVRGIVEAYSYVGGTRDGGSITTNLDLFQRGGMAQSAGGSNYDYNTYEMDVSPPVTGEANVYFLNSVSAAEGPHASNSPTQHLTFPINYTKTIKVMGNSVITLKVFDSNCTLVQNCGPTMGNTCAAPRTVSLSGVTPAAPSSFMQPFQNSGRYGQWVYFDVTAVTAN